MSRTVGDDASTNKMLQAETLSFGGQSSQREQERRFQLQMERGEEMRRFLATQAANTHPRLARLMKKNQMPAASITEIRQSIQLPQIRSAERRQSESVSPAAKTSFEERLDESQRQPLMQKPQQQNNYAQGTEPFYGYPIQPMPYQMGFPQYQQYQPYQPNPYLPPISQFSGFGGSGYRDPHAQQFPPNSFPSSNYPQPPPGQPPSEMYFRHRNVNDFNLNAQPTSQPTSRRSTDRGRDLRESHQYGRRQDNHQSKEQYAAELERQIKEKEERKRKERNFRSQPESGFIGDKVVSQRNVNQNNGSREGMGNIGYDEHQNHNNRSHQQSLYLRELDEQIRIKKEMQTKERVHAEHTQFPPQTAVYIAPEFNEGRRGSRKQFPTETAKIFNSLVFPIAAQRNPSQIRSKYAPLPGIRSASNSNDNLPSMFPPPASNDTSGAIDLGASNFVRGATHVSNMVGWQKDEFMAKQDLKRKNQLEIQDALKQQIAQKEYLKRKKIADERAEDDKERARIEHEQAMLKERYQKEKEEARIKEEQDLKEKQVAIAEKNARKKQMQEDIPIPQKAKKVFRRPSPEPQMNTNPQPFRSNSPPLPAVLKKMKEDGIEYIPPRSNPASAGADRLEVESVQGVKPATAEDEAHNITSRRNSLKPASARHSRMESRSKVRDTFAADDGSANRQLLEQLEAIQRELQSEDEKVRKDIQNATTEAVLEYDKNRFETELDEINIEINKDEHLKKWQPEVDYKRKPLAPRQAKPVHFQRYRDIVTPKSVTYTPPVYNFDRSNQLSAETELVSITKNIQRLNHDFSSFSPEPTNDLFNIDEIEKRNEARLRKLQTNYSSSALKSGDDLIARFMARQNSGNRSIPTSPSTFHPIPLDQIEL